MGEEALEPDKTENIRRAPTPFPKEMRAMAKKAQSMREKKAAEEIPSNNLAISPLLSERQDVNTPQEEQNIKDQMIAAMAQVIPSSRWKDSIATNCARPCQNTNCQNPNSTNNSIELG